MSRDRVVVMLSPGFPPEFYGGAEKQCLRLSSALQELGHEVIILTGCGMPGLPIREVMDGVDVRRVQTRHPPDQGGRHILSSIKWTAMVLVWLFRRRHDIRLVHVHQGKFHFLPAYLAKILFGLPFIVKVGNAEEKFDLERLAGKAGGYGRLALRGLIKHCAAHVAISSRIAEQMAAIGVPPERTHRIPNGIDIAGFQAGPPAPWGEGRRFLFLGRLEEEKQPMMLMRCFGGFLKDPDNPSRDDRLIVAGDGPELGAMAAFCRANAVEDQVDLLGRVDDVRALIASAHFFVLPSKNEGMSNALLEAMSCGLVPIASAISGSTDIIRHGENGFLFPRDDDAAFVACLKTASTMSEGAWRALRDAARQTIERDYSMARVAQSYSALYEQVDRSP